MAVTIVQQPDELMLSLNPITYLLESDLTGQDIRFSIIIEAESSFGTNDFAPLGEAFQKVANNSKQQYFDLSCTLNSILEAVNPDPTQTTKLEGTTHCKRYRIQYSDFDETTPISYTTHTEKFVLIGGLTFKGYLSRVANTLPTNNQLMTIRPQQNRLFYIGQYEWMWLLPSSSGVNIDLQINITYTDGSTDNSITANYGTTTQYLPIGIPLHDSIHNYSQISSNKEIATIEFTCLGESLLCLNSFDCYNYIREFTYLNSIGGFDSLVTYGKGQTTEEISKEISETSQIPNYDQYFRQFKTFNASKTIGETVASGYRSQAERQAAKDALLSKAVYTRVGDSYCPVFIGNIDSTDELDGDYRYKLDFEYTFANQEFAIAPQ